MSLVVGPGKITAENFKKSFFKTRSSSLYSVILLRFVMNFLIVFESSLSFSQIILCFHLRFPVETCEPKTELGSQGGWIKATAADLLHPRAPRALSSSKLRAPVFQIDKNACMPKGTVTQKSCLYMTFPLIANFWWLLMFARVRSVSVIIGYRETLEFWALSVEWIQQLLSCTSEGSSWKLF